MSFAREIEAGHLKVGDLIADRVDPKTGVVRSAHPVKKIEWRRGCPGIHVNDRECWTGLVPVVIKEVSA